MLASCSRVTSSTITPAQTKVRCHAVALTSVPDTRQKSGSRTRPCDAADERNGAAVAGRRIEYAVTPRGLGERGSRVRQRIGRPQTLRDLVQAPADRDRMLDKIETPQQQACARVQLDDEREHADLEGRDLAPAKPVDIAVRVA